MLKLRSYGYVLSGPFFMLCVCGVYLFSFLFSFSFPLRLLGMEGGHIWVVCSSWKHGIGKVFFIFYYGFVFFLTIHFIVCLGGGMRGAWMRK